MEGDDTEIRELQEKIPEMKEFANAADADFHKDVAAEEAEIDRLGKELEDIGDADSELVVDDRGLKIDDRDLEIDTANYLKIEEEDVRVD